ncbi:hypothetical protein KFE25_003040 [Diacronema lutheri]|uniref:Calmodulin-lysine N-methyltransferase n=1 Tax=Diacronema lutheri TaxID=2081491 RepID=A0A8J5X8M8_DIALT|nr:hypothetical protein KFE25_003040 [Diacronema lutheri]
MEEGDSTRASELVVSVLGRTIRVREQQHEGEFAPIFSDAWTGSRVWAAAHMLVAHLAERAHAGLVAGARCLELGAGPGLCGLAAAALGAESVVLTDQREMLDLLRANIALNPQLPRVSAAELNWACGAPAEMRERFDLVLVSDCINEIYGEESFGQLAATIRAVCAPGGTCVLTHEERSADGVAATAFRRFEVLCAELGLAVCRLDSPARPSAAQRVAKSPSGGPERRPAAEGEDEGGPDGDIRLFELRPGVAPVDRG